MSEEKKAEPCPLGCGRPTDHPEGFPCSRCWVITEGGYDSSEVVGVWTNKEEAEAVHAAMTVDIKQVGGINRGYGVSLEETDLHT